MNKWWQPADIIWVAVYPIGSKPEREIVYRQSYKWRWLAKLVWYFSMRWHYEAGIKVFIFVHVVDKDGGDEYVLV